MTAPPFQYTTRGCASRPSASAHTNSQRGVRAFHARYSAPNLLSSTGASPRNHIDMVSQEDKRHKKFTNLAPLAQSAPASDAAVGQTTRSIDTTRNQTIARPESGRCRRQTAVIRGTTMRRCRARLNQHASTDRPTDQPTNRPNDAHSARTQDRLPNRAVIQTNKKRSSDDRKRRTSSNAPGRSPDQRT